MLEIASARDWEMLADAAGRLRRVLLFGPAGSGKSYAARTLGVPDGARVYSVPLTQETPAAELRGHYVMRGQGQTCKACGEPVADAGAPTMAWHDGPVSRWMRDRGSRLRVDEITRASEDALSFLLAATDDPESAQVTLPTGEDLSPAEGITVWATTNDRPDDLPDALADRFPVSVYVGAVAPGALARLPEDLRGMARDRIETPTAGARMGLRSWLEFSRLRSEGMADADAARLVFGESDAREIADALRLASSADGGVESR